ncbi:MAG: phenylalanine--tRNA ligase subunit alpha [Alkalispirochaetaceae bacterium]
MISDSTLRSLHPLEVKTLRQFDGSRSFSQETMVGELGFNTGQANQAVSWLLAKGYIAETDRSARTIFERTDLGATYAEGGTPEERIIAHLKKAGPTPMSDLAAEVGLEKKDVGSAFGQLSKQGVLRMNEDKLVELLDENKATELPLLRQLLERAGKGPIEERALTDEERRVIAGVAKKRGAGSTAFKILEREDVQYQVTPMGMEAKSELERAGITGDEIGELSPELLADGSWRNRGFRAYNMQLPPGRVVMGRRNPYCEYLDFVKDKLSSLGFQEFDGPLVETEFWNSDALFMPQFHAARDIHDVYYVKNPSHAREIDEPYLSQVAKTHEDGWRSGSRGWRYSFDRDFTRRLILRSQGTVMSAKTLPRAEVPGKYFGILRCFRYDQVDATHLSDFYQTEGIVLGEEVNLRTLLGFLRMFAEELAGAEDIRYVPGYFPFTEPSVEVHIKHPVLGWFELGGSGIFRPEVTTPLGIDVPVLAWGLGIDRMALMHLGLNDLRELFSFDIENVRLRRRSMTDA